MVTFPTPQPIAAARGYRLLVCFHPSLLHPELVVEPHLDRTGLMARKEVAPKQDLGAAACRRKGYWEGTRKTICGSLMSFSGSNNPALTILTTLVAQMARSLPAMRYTWVQSLGPKDPPKMEMATYSSILDWKIPWTEEPGGLTGHGVPKSWTQLSKFHLLRHPRSRALRGCRQLDGQVCFLNTSLSLPRQIQPGPL